MFGCSRSVHRIRSDALVVAAAAAADAVTVTVETDHASLTRTMARLPPELRRVVVDYCVNTWQEVASGCDREISARKATGKNDRGGGDIKWDAPVLLPLVLGRQSSVERNAQWSYACAHECLATATWLLTAAHRENHKRSGLVRDETERKRTIRTAELPSARSPPPAFPFPFPDVFAWHTQSFAPFYTETVDRTLKLTAECMYLDAASIDVGRRRALPLDQVASVHRPLDGKRASERSGPPGEAALREKQPHERSGPAGGGDTILVTTRSGTRVTVFVDAVHARQISVHIIQRVSHLAAAATATAAAATADAANVVGLGRSEAVAATVAVAASETSETREAAAAVAVAVAARSQTEEPRSAR